MPHIEHAGQAGGQGVLARACDAPNAVLRIELAKPGERARKVKSRAKTRPTGAHPSFRMRRMLHWESPGEQHAIKLFDVDPSVTLLAEQPCVIYYRLDGTVHRHYPDLRVVSMGADWLYEVKTREEAASEEVQSRTRLLTAELPRFGFRYAVLIAEDLKKQPRLANAEFLLRHGRQELTLAELDEIRRYLKGRNSFPLAAVRGGAAGPLSAAHMCRLILEGVLSVDLGSKWDAPGTLVHVGQVGLSGVLP